MFRSEKPSDIPNPGLARSGRDQLGLGVAGVSELIVPFPDRLARGQVPVHRAFRAQGLPFVQKCRDHLGRRAVDKARGAKGL